MLAILAWLGTSIFWTLTTAQTTPPLLLSPNALETEPRKAAQLVVARHIFGEVATAAPVTVAPTDIRLSGVIAAQHPGQMALAILALEGKPAVAVREGDEVAPGITLSRVQPRQVELLRGGQTQVLTLPEPNATAAQAGAPVLQINRYSPQPSGPVPTRTRRSRRNSSPSSEPD